MHVCMKKIVAAYIPAADRAYIYVVATYTTLYNNKKKCRHFEESILPFMRYEILSSDTTCSWSTEFLPFMKNSTHGGGESEERSRALLRNPQKKTIHKHEKLSQKLYKPSPNKMHKNISQRSQHKLWPRSNLSPHSPTSPLLPKNTKGLHPRHTPISVAASVVFPVVPPVFTELRRKNLRLLLFYSFVHNLVGVTCSSA